MEAVVHTVNLEEHQSKCRQITEPSFTKRIFCPFCWEQKRSKRGLVEHLDKNCQKKPKNTLVNVCKILDDKGFQCVFCFSFLSTIKDCLFHVYSRKHALQCRKLAQTEDYTPCIWCQPCKVRIPCGSADVSFHLQLDMHRIRYESSYLKREEFFSRNIHIICCLGIKGPQIQCLICPHLNKFPLSSFPHHLQSDSHLRMKVHTTKESIYCSFCTEEVLCVEAMYHFASEKHLGNVKKLSAPESYCVCILCGILCSKLLTLSKHMRGNCAEALNIRKQIKSETGEMTSTLEYFWEHSDQINKERSILVEANVEICEDISYLLSIFKHFGKITCIGKFNEEKFLVEFSTVDAITDIMLVEKFIKVNGKKIKIEFLS